MVRLKIGWASADVSTDKALNMPGQDNGTYPRNGQWRAEVSAQVSTIIW